MKKDDISSHRGYRNQLNHWKFSDYGIAVGHHKRHGDYETDNLPLTDLADLLLDLF